MPARRIALSAPGTGKGASAYRTVNVRLFSNYNSYVSYIFSRRNIYMSPLILVAQAGTPKIALCLWLL